MDSQIETMSSISGVAKKSLHINELRIVPTSFLVPATFKVSRDPRFEDKLLDVVGLYLNPPEHALVLSCDEKSQIQALNRTQPGLPMKAGRAGTVIGATLRAMHRAWPEPDLRARRMHGVQHDRIAAASNGNWLQGGRFEWTQLSPSRATR